MIHLVDTFTPAGLVGLLPAEFPKPFVADDMVGSEMLELCRICTGRCRQRHQLERALQVTVVIGGNIRDEIRGVFCSQSFRAYFHNHLFLFRAHATKVIHDCFSLRECSGDSLDSGRNGMTE